MSSIEADGLLRLMNSQHQQNRGDIESLKQGQQELTQTLTNLVGEIGGATRVLRLLAWMVMAVLASLGVWFTSLEFRGKVSDNRIPAAVSYQQPSTQDAHNPYLPPR